MLLLPTRDGGAAWPTSTTSTGLPSRSIDDLLSKADRQRPAAMLQMHERGRPAAAYFQPARPIDHNLKQGEDAHMTDCDDMDDEERSAARPAGGLGLRLDAIDSESGEVNSLQLHLHHKQRWPSPSALSSSPPVTPVREWVMNPFDPLSSPPRDNSPPAHEPWRSWPPVQLPPSPPSPRRSLPTGCNMIPWIDEDDHASFWLPCSAIPSSSTELRLDAKPPSPPLCPLASPPPSPHRRSLALPIAPPAPPSALARAPSGALRSKSSSSRRGSRSRSERRSLSERGRCSEPGSSLDRRASERSPPRRSLKKGRTTMMIKSTPAPPGYGVPSASVSTTWPAVENYNDEDGHRVSFTNDPDDFSDDDDGDDMEDELYDARFVDLPSIRHSLSLKHPISSPIRFEHERPRRRSLQKLHSEQWRLFALGAAKEQRTGQGYWTNFDLDLS